MDVERGWNYRLYLPFRLTRTRGHQNVSLDSRETGVGIIQDLLFGFFRYLRFRKQQRKREEKVIEQISASTRGRIWAERAKEARTAPQKKQQSIDQLMSCIQPPIDSHDTATPGS